MYYTWFKHPVIQELGTIKYSIHFHEIKNSLRCTIHVLYMIQTSKKHVLYMIQTSTLLGTIKYHNTFPWTKKIIKVYMYYTWCKHKKTKKSDIFPRYLDWRRAGWNRTRCKYQKKEEI